jgi:hypothetical protein
MREEVGGWQLVSAVPRTRLDFTSAVWVLFRRPVLFPDGETGGARHSA